MGVTSRNGSRAALLACFLGGALVGQIVLTGPACGQAPAPAGGAAAPAGGAAAGAGGAAAPAAAAGGGAAAPAAAAGGGAGAANDATKPPAAPTDEHAGESNLWWVCRSSGWIGAFLVLLSMYFIATVIQLFIQFRPDVAAPPEVLQECEALVTQPDIPGMYNVISADDSYFSVTLAAGIRELRSGVNEAREIMERQADALTAEMEKKTSILAVIGTLGPMIGLLGTLLGMISSFSVIAHSKGAVEPSKVADGISSALIITFEGVFLSVPAIFFFAFFRNRIATISLNTLLKADDFLRRVGRLAKSKPTTPARA